MDIQILHILVYFSIINLLGYGVFYYDKYLATQSYRRIPESLLILIHGVGGFIGSIYAMYTIRHKNKKLSFLMKFYFVLLLELTIITYLIYYNTINIL